MKKEKKPKPGKVIRVSPPVWDLLTEHRRDGETVDALVRRLLGLSPRKGESEETVLFFICPESQVILSGCKDIAEARGQLLLKKKKLIEDPIPVRKVIGG
jgi:hypothetical protein